MWANPKKRGLLIAVGAFVGGIGLLLLSYTEPQTPDGVDLVVNAKQYNDSLLKAVELSKDPLFRFDSGGELNDEDRGNLKEAVKYCEAMNDFQPTLFAPYLLAGKIYLALGEYQKASERLEQCIVNAPLHHKAATHREAEMTAIEARYNLSLVRFAQADYEAALAEADLAAKAVPSSALYLTARASALVQMGRLDEAKADLQRALKLEPDNLRTKKLLELVERAQKPSS